MNSRVANGSSDIELKSTSALKNDFEKDREQKTNWKLIILAGLITGLTAVENSVIGVGEWPYMREIDREATANFFGRATSTSKFGHAIFALVFSIWSYKTHSVKTPLIVGRIFAVIACLIYVNIEHFQNGRRYVLAMVYLILGIANSANTVLRGYIVSYSIPKDRPRAFAIIGISIIASIVIGPTLNLVFSRIPYPGYEILPGIYFHIYSAPIWFSFILTILTIFIISYFMEDVQYSQYEKENEPPMKFSIGGMKNALRELKKSNNNWRLIIICLIVKIAGTFSHSTMQTIVSVLFIVHYGWSGRETIMAAAGLMIAFGMLSFLVLVLYIFCRIGEIFAQHKMFLIATIASGFVFIITYPYPAVSNRVAVYNATTRTGCNPEEYSWCENAYAVNSVFFLIVTALISGPAIPIMHTALDTIYSNILGDIDQSIAQGAMTIVDDIVFIFTPAFTTEMFTLFGLGPLWIIKSLVYFSISALWIANMKRFAAHS